MELIKFVTPSDFMLNGIEVEIAWDDGLSNIVSSVHIIVDDNADPDHPEYDAWSVWDEDIFYYCESEQEWNDLLAYGHYDGWKVLQ